mgnify:CR=1 FL=1
MPHHIVIVEDEPVTQARLQSYFTQEGYTVSVTASGAGLREIMQNQPVDLILLDINLPDENGLMLTRALRERSTVGIILVPDFVSVATVCNRCMKNINSRCISRTPPACELNAMTVISRRIFQAW